MIEKDKLPGSENFTRGKHKFLFKLLIVGFILIFLVISLRAGMLVYNNVSFLSDADFAQQLDAAI